MSLAKLWQTLSERNHKTQPAAPKLRHWKWIEWDKVSYDFKDDKEDRDRKVDLYSGGVDACTLVTDQDVDTHYNDPQLWQTEILYEMRGLMDPPAGVCPGCFALASEFYDMLVSNELEGDAIFFRGKR